MADLTHPSLNPALLHPGDYIGVFAPSSYVEREDIEASKKELERRGYRVLIHPQTYMRHHQSAGRSEDKLSAFHSLLEHPEVKVIWAAGGGNRALHFVDQIDYNLVKAAAKPIVGFSDVTSLLNAIYAHCGLMSYHAPVFRQLHHKTDPLEQTLHLLRGECSGEVYIGNCSVLSPGRATGHLIGGNLSLFQYLPQTLPGKFWQHAILFLEDCNEEYSHTDRMLLHLRRTGVLEEISGIIFGEFTNMKDSARPFGFDLDEIFQEHLRDLNIPAITHAPVGHGERNHPLKIGESYTLDTVQKTLRINYS